MNWLQRAGPSICENVEKLLGSLAYLLRVKSWTHSQKSYGNRTKRKPSGSMRKSTKNLANKKDTRSPDKHTRVPSITTTKRVGLN